MQGVKWKEGNYEFTNVDLSSWIEIVGRIYNVKISLEHGQATKNLLNGRLRYNESLEEAIEKCASVQGGDIERKMENISYSVKGIL